MSPSETKTFGTQIKEKQKIEGTAQKMSRIFSLSAIYGLVFSEIGMRYGSVEVLA